MVLSLVVLLPLSCKPHSKPAEDSSSSGSNPSVENAELTRKMEEKAADIRTKEEEIRNMQGTDEEKADAVKKLDAERQELIEMQDKAK
jgi:TolA-binding protein